MEHGEGLAQLLDGCAWWGLILKEEAGTGVFPWVGA